jgi:hypothetical protein
VLTKRGLIGGGITLMVADFGFAISGYPWLVTNHPSSLWIIGAIAIVLIAIGFILPREQEQNAPGPVLPNNNQQEIGTVAGGSVSVAGGSASAAGNQMTVNFNSVPAFPPEEASQAWPKTPPLSGRTPFQNWS